MDRRGISERRACRDVGQHRSTQRHEPFMAVGGVAVRAVLRRICSSAAAVGHGRAYQVVLDERWRRNCKRSRRPWREEDSRCRSGGARSGGWVSRPPDGAAHGPRVLIMCRRWASSAIRPLYSRCRPRRDGASLPSRRAERVGVRPVRHRC